MDAAPEDAGPGFGRSARLQGSAWRLFAGRIAARVPNSGEPARLQVGSGVAQAGAGPARRQRPGSSGDPAPGARSRLVAPPRPGGPSASGSKMR